MQLGVCASAMGECFADQIEAAAAAGFETLELRGAVDGTPLPQLDDRTFRDLCEQAAEHGLGVATLALGLLDRHAADLDGLRRVGELSALAGARVRLFSSLRPDGEDPGREPGLDALNREAETLADCVGALRRTNPGVLVMVEGEPNGVANSVARQIALLDILGDDQVGLNWDYVNLWMAGEYPWPQPWALLQSRVLGIHFKSARAVPHEPWRYAGQCLPGEGDLPLAAMWTAWAAAGFDGPITVDPHHALFSPADRLQPEPESPNRVICERSLPVMQALRQTAWERLAA